MPTTRFTRGKLPHWEVEGGRYFVTVRCADRVQLKVKSVRGSFRRFGERTRPACWCRRPADTPENPGGTPRPACGTQALPGKFLRAADASDFTPGYTRADSLPQFVVDRLRDIHETLANTDAASPQFAALQRQYFSTMDKHLGGGAGECPLRDIRAAEAVVAELEKLSERDVAVPHYSVMPNHWHALYLGAAFVSSWALRPGRRSENSPPSDDWRRARWTMPIFASRLSIMETNTASGVAA